MNEIATAKKAIADGDFNKVENIRLGLMRKMYAQSREFENKHGNIVDNLEKYWRETDRSFDTKLEVITLMRNKAGKGPGFYPKVKIGNRLYLEGREKPPL